MSLTAELNNPKSPIYQWLLSKTGKGAYKLINNHNILLARQPLIAPPSYNVNFPLIGTAITYAVRDAIMPLSQTITQTPAWTGACWLSVSQSLAALLEKNLAPREQAIAYALLAVLEARGRGRHHEILDAMIQGGRYLPLEQKFWQRYQQTIDDIEGLVASIPHTLSTLPLSGVLIPCPVFAGSDYLPADAQMIVGKMLVDVRTTTKKRPFTLSNLFQQVAYTLMDWDDEYGINSLAWCYVRQQCAFYYPIAKMFKDLPTLREEFREFLIANYNKPELDAFMHEDYFPL